MGYKLYIVMCSHTVVEQERESTPVPQIVMCSCLVPEHIVSLFLSFLEKKKRRPFTHCSHLNLIPLTHLTRIPQKDSLNLMPPDKSRKSMLKITTCNTDFLSFPFLSLFFAKR